MIVHTIVAPEFENDARATGAVCWIEASTRIERNRRLVSDNYLGN